MPRLLLFNPENDLALAFGRVRYTPPPYAAALRRDLARLPLLYADEGDRLLCDGGWQQGFVPSPWGWSAAVRDEFLRAGTPPELLPTMQEIEQLRQLSHRRTAAELAHITGIGKPAKEVTSPQQLADILDAAARPLMLKSPWSSSGRGLIDTSIVGRDEVLRQASGMIARQGSVMVETLHKVSLDFALLYDIDSHGVTPQGYSIFATNTHRAYTGNILASLHVLRQTIADCYGALDHAEKAITAGLATLLVGRYTGPVGVDLIVTESGDLHICEINLRMTMGRVAAEHHRRTGLTGHLSVVKDASGFKLEIRSQEMREVWTKKC